MGFLLELANIETYYGPVNAIKGISLSIDEGEIRTILGANGAGKTTILRTISGLIKPEKGSIRFLGKEIQNLRPDRIVRLGISHVPEGREIFPDLTVLENLRMGAFVSTEREDLKKNLELIFEYFPVLRDRGKQRAGTLSGGEQQMLAIGRALLSRPKLMLFDEPSLGLSPKLVKQIFRVIKSIHERQGSSILLIEQNARAALKIASYGYILEAGRVVLDGSTASLLENEDVREFYLGIKETSPKGFKRWKRKKRWR
ncbi:MAG: ABC transporter ATP-binding protein [Pseudomonadota bacterium]